MRAMQERAKDKQAERVRKGGMLTSYGSVSWHAVCTITSTAVYRMLCVPRETRRHLRENGGGRRKRRPGRSEL